MSNILFLETNKSVFRSEATGSVWSHGGRFMASQYDTFLDRHNKNTPYKQTYADNQKYFDRFPTTIGTIYDLKVIDYAEFSITRNK